MLLTIDKHFVRSVRIWCVFRPVSPAFGMSTKKPKCQNLFIKMKCDWDIWIISTDTAFPLLPFFSQPVYISYGFWSGRKTSFRIRKLVKFSNLWNKVLGRTLNEKSRVLFSNRIKSFTHVLIHVFLCIKYSGKQKLCSC